MALGRRHGAETSGSLQCTIPSSLRSAQTRPAFAPTMLEDGTLAQPWCSHERLFTRTIPVNLRSAQKSPILAPMALKDGCLAYLWCPHRCLEHAHDEPERNIPNNNGPGEDEPLEGRRREGKCSKGGHATSSSTSSRFTLTGYLCCDCYVARVSSEGIFLTNTCCAEWAYPAPRHKTVHFLRRGLLSCKVKYKALDIVQKPPSPPRA